MQPRRWVLALLRLNPHAFHRRLRALLDFIQRHGPLGGPDQFARIRHLLRLLPPRHGLPVLHVRHLLSQDQHLPRGCGMGARARLLAARGYVLANGKRQRGRCWEVLNRRRGFRVCGECCRLVDSVRVDVRVG